MLIEIRMGKKRRVYGLSSLFGDVKNNLQKYGLNDNPNVTKCATATSGHRPVSDCPPKGNPIFGLMLSSSHLRIEICESSKRSLTADCWG